MTDERDDTDKPEFCWVYEKGDLDQDAFSISDPEGHKLAAILPANRARPIETGYNALLMLRSFGSQDWNDAGIRDLGRALVRGNEHAHQYRIQHQAEYTLNQVKREGLEMPSDRAPKMRVPGPAFDKGRER